jgi:hypothetical protein
MLPRQDINRFDERLGYIIRRAADERNINLTRDQVTTVIMLDEEYKEQKRQAEQTTA